MRIVHISDIHLSKDNYDVIQNYYIDHFIEIIENEQKEGEINLIVITGDLVDKGGDSLLEIEKFNSINDPYIIFEQTFIDPIKNQLKFDNSKILFIPGNHDVDGKSIKQVDEEKLQDIEMAGNINDLLVKNIDFNFSNERIKLFKNFEKRFHKDTPNYTYSNYESTYIFENREGIRIGIALINDTININLELLKIKTSEAMEIIREDYKILISKIRSLIDEKRKI